MLKNEIGTNAGKIWGILNEKGELSLTKLKTASKLNEKVLCMAIGWLAREHIIDIHEKQKEIHVGLSLINS